MSILPALIFLVAFFPAVEPVPRSGACEGAEGVTVAADLGGEVLVRCVPGSPGDARTALERSGLAVRLGSGTGPYGESGYVCRVEDLPEADPCTGHRDGAPFWKVWRAGVDPLAWRESRTQGGPGAVRVCPGGLVGFGFGPRTSQMTVPPEQVVTTPGWLPPHCP
ncbi:hypothetical protein [Amycolatopsis sp. lyj-112]|uniref:hypothetical protein n=1 Tax=Amycolatopsis sp. lyj-112 TaxID=2789288 RepID=UPI003978C0FD